MNVLLCYCVHFLQHGTSRRDVNEQPFLMTKYWGNPKSYWHNDAVLRNCWISPISTIFDFVPIRKYPRLSEKHDLQTLSKIPCRNLGKVYHEIARFVLDFISVTQLKPEPATKSIDLKAPSDSLIFRWKRLKLNRLG